ncbi:MAG: cytochrome c biogenesis protein CcdA [Streptosporangiales bacterium]|nr:cytochrome c biogenesis protein CcdA [Streptosporangiales bacterium]
MFAGLVSFLSPCVLPLAPGYVSYVTGLSGADLAAGGHRGRTLAGSALFVAGFSAVVVSAGALFGGVGYLLQEYADPITRVLGVVTFALGLAFIGMVPWLQRDTRPVHRWPAHLGMVGAPLLGVLFGIGWTPCLSPTLGAVQTLAFSEGSALRGAVLGVAYCVGLGLPFLLAGVAFRHALGAFGRLRRLGPLVTRVGGAMLMVLGVLLVTGVWTQMVMAMRGWVSGFQTIV